MSGSQFPKPLDPMDDQPPATVITRKSRQADGAWLVHGTTAADGSVKRVVVNGCEARPTRANFAEREAVAPAAVAKSWLSAFGEDAAANIKPKPHVVTLSTTTSAPAARNAAAC